MSDKANARIAESGVKSFLDTLKTRLGIIGQGRERAGESQRLETLLQEIDLEIRGDESEVQSRPVLAPKLTKDASLQRRITADELKIVDLAIDRKYGQLRSGSLEGEEEELCVESIRKLEMRRLDLMTRLHGQDLKGYAATR